MFLFKTPRSQPLVGEKTNLRSLRKEDVRTIHAWLDDRELMELAFGISASDPNFQSLVPAYKKEIDANRIGFFAIEDKNDRLIGFCSNTLFQSEQRARIGILIGDRNYWNKGYGRDAVIYLLRYLFTDRNMRVVELDTAPFNVRAQRCFQSCGFKLVHQDRGQTGGRLWYEIQREEFLARFGS